LRPLLLCLTLWCLALAGCVTPGGQPPREPVYASAEERAEAHLRVLEEVWRKVERRFYARDFNGADWATAYDRHAEQAAAAPDTEALYEVINAMLAELGDAHTAALTPHERWQDYVATRALVGINLE